jgi:hypothetical protein
METNASIKITFWRNENYDKSSAKRSLPYKGKSWFVIKTYDKPRLLEFIKDKRNPLNIKDFTFKDVDVKNLKNINIIALNYKQANDYVVGDSNVKPESVPFNYKTHTMKFLLIPPIKNGMFSVKTIRQYKCAPYYPYMTYQVVIPENFLSENK